MAKRQPVVAESALPQIRSRAAHMPVQVGRPRCRVNDTCHNSAIEDTLQGLQSHDLIEKTQEWIDA